MKKNLVLIFVVCITGMFMSCKNNSESKVVEEAVNKVETPAIVKATDKKGKEYTSSYVCPMYCVGSGSEHKGKCPACKMDYVFNKEHGSAYICPMHCKGSGSTEMGQCPVCKMDYVANAKADHSGHDHSGHDHSGHSH